MKTELIYSIYYYTIIKRTDESGNVDFIIKVPNGRNLGTATSEAKAKDLIIGDIQGNEVMENKPSDEVKFAGDPNAESSPNNDKKKQDQQSHLLNEVNL